MTWLLEVAFAFVDTVDAVRRTGDVWGPVLLAGGLAVGGWRIRPRSGRHRLPSAAWARARTVLEAARTAASARIRPGADGRPSSPDETSVTCADGRPAVSADGRPPAGGREDGGA